MALNPSGTEECGLEAARFIANPTTRRGSNPARLCVIQATRRARAEIFALPGPPLPPTHTLRAPLTLASSSIYNVSVDP